MMIDSIAGLTTLITLVIVCMFNLCTVLHNLYMYFEGPPPPPKNKTT